MIKGPTELSFDEDRWHRIVKRLRRDSRAQESCCFHTAYPQQKSPDWVLVSLHGRAFASHASRIAYYLGQFDTKYIVTKMLKFSGHVFFPTNLTLWIFRTFKSSKTHFVEINISKLITYSTDVLKWPRYYGSETPRHCLMDRPTSFRFACEDFQAVWSTTARVGRHRQPIGHLLQSNQGLAHSQVLI
jgi:hypothetical protein